MGNMIPANNISSWLQTVKDPPGINPGPNATPTFDPMFGFENGRKERGKHRNHFAKVLLKKVLLFDLCYVCNHAIFRYSHGCNERRNGCCKFSLF